MLWVELSWWTWFLGTGSPCVLLSFPSNPPIEAGNLRAEPGPCISLRRHLATPEGTWETLCQEVLGGFFCCYFHTQKRGFPFHSRSSGKWNLYKTFLAHDGKHLLASNERMWPKSNCNKNLRGYAFSALHLRFSLVTAVTAVFASSWFCLKLLNLPYITGFIQMTKSYCFSYFLFFFFSPPGQI